MIIFSYGSNMCFNRIHARVRSVKHIDIGYLEGHRMQCIKRSTVDGSGKATLIETGKVMDRVWGVIYEISDDDKLILDKYEGLGIGYREIYANIKGNNRLVNAQIYTGNESFYDRSVLPFRWYWEYILQGALEYKLPGDYIQKIRSIDSMDDHNERRKRVNSNILRGVY